MPIGRIIFNPTSGPRDVHWELQQVQDELRKRGWTLDTVSTKGPEDSLRLARGAAEAGLDAVWVAGGDGTIRDTLNGLVHSRTALAVLPVGTGNLWAKQLHLPTYTLTNPFRLREAAIAQSEGYVRVIDVGRLGERYFLLWAGIGFDARITTELEPRPRPVKRMGAMAYILAAATLAYDYSGVRTQVMVDGRVVRGRTLMILVSNVQNYAILNICKQAKMDDGLLNVVIFRGLGVSYIARHVLKVFSGRHLQDPKVIHRQARRVVINAEVPIPVQADGDPLGQTPVTLEVVPRALRILAPPQAPAGLFSTPPLHQDDL
ncbi:MAG: diacylglycerol kinase family lipid kinase, partial [Anaerolineae bacterium]|nr:diacylglycerol kinase family lipid kinase [Anaerolineae bacterium]